MKTMQRIDHEEQRRDQIAMHFLELEDALARFHHYVINGEKPDVTSASYVDISLLVGKIYELLLVDYEVVTPTKRKKMIKIQPVPDLDERLAGVRA